MFGKTNLKYEMVKGFLSTKDQAKMHKNGFVKGDYSCWISTVVGICGLPAAIKVANGLIDFDQTAARKIIAHIANKLKGQLHLFRDDFSDSYVIDCRTGARRNYCSANFVDDNGYRVYGPRGHGGGVADLIANVPYTHYQNYNKMIDNILAGKPVSKIVECPGSVTVYYENGEYGYGRCYSHHQAYVREKNELAKIFIDAVSQEHSLDSIMRFIKKLNLNSDDSFWVESNVRDVLDQCKLK
jgi:hypothetical protein